MGLLIEKRHREHALCALGCRTRREQHLGPSLSGPDDEWHAIWCESGDERFVPLRILTALKSTAEEFARFEAELLAAHEAPNLLPLTLPEPATRSTLGALRPCTEP